MWWRNSWSITGQTHKKTDVNLSNSLPLSPDVTLTRPYRENRYLKVALNSYLGLFALRKKSNWFTSKGRQLLARTLQIQSEYSLEFLNFVAFTTPNKHKKKSEDLLFTSWPKFVFEYFCDSRRILASFAKIFLKSLFAIWWYRYPNPKRGSSARSSSHPPPTRFFWHIKSWQNPSSATSYYRRILLKRFKY